MSVAARAVRGEDAEGEVQDEATAAVDAMGGGGAGVVVAAAEGAAEAGARGLRTGRARA